MICYFLWVRLSALQELRHICFVFKGTGGTRRRLIKCKLLWFAKLKLILFALVSLKNEEGCGWSDKLCRRFSSVAVWYTFSVLTWHDSLQEEVSCCTWWLKQVKSELMSRCNARTGETRKKNDRHLLSYINEMLWEELISALSACFHIMHNIGTKNIADSILLLLYPTRIWNVGPVVIWGCDLFLNKVNKKGP